MGDIFYPFNWAVLEKGYKIKYIYPKYNEEFKSTEEFKLHNSLNHTTV